MGKIDLRLDEQSETFIDRQIASGRFASADEVVREGLRALEERERKLEALRAHLAIGEAQADRGEFIDFDFDSFMEELDREGFDREE